MLKTLFVWNCGMLETICLEPWNVEILEIRISQKYDIRLKINKIPVHIPCSDARSVTCSNIINPNFLIEKKKKRS